MGIVGKGAGEKNGARKSEPSLRAGSLVWVGDKEPRTGEPGERRGKVSLHASYCWFSHDVTKFQTSELFILPRFYFHDV